MQKHLCQLFHQLKIAGKRGRTVPLGLHIWGNQYTCCKTTAGRHGKLEKKIIVTQSHTKHQQPSPSNASIPCCISHESTATPTSVDNYDPPGLCHSIIKPYWYSKLTTHTEYCLIHDTRFIFQLLVQMCLMREIQMKMVTLNHLLIRSEMAKKYIWF